MVKLYGGLSDPESLVLDAWDHDELMDRLSRKLEIVTAFRSLRPPLFVGFDLADDTPRRLYVRASTNMVEHMRRAYAVWPHPLDAVRAVWRDQNVEFGRADDYRAQLTLSDDTGGPSGLEAFVQLSGQAMWVWGEDAGGENPGIWAILTNEDYDGDGVGVGDQDEWLAFSDAPYGVPDPYATTSYLSVYPYINNTGTLVTDTFQAFLAAAHSTGDIRVEVLAGTHKWVETDEGLQHGKDRCDVILNFNRAGATPAERFDGIHYDVEHDDWYTGTRWARYLDLITYCQTQVDTYNQTHEPIVFGVDIPPHFLTGPGSSGAVKSGWDVLSIVDYIALMDYRDFADVRWDGRTDGIIPRAEPFIADGNALGKPVVIGVELTENRYNHVTFFEECTALMEDELHKVSRYFAGDRAYKGIAIHDYAAWKEKEWCAFLPVILKNNNP